MSELKTKLTERSESKCELCESIDNLSVYELPPVISATVDNSVLVCSHCLEQIEDNDKIDVNHWHCLNASMWSEFVPVQILAYRMLFNLRQEGWASDLLEQMYLDDEALAFAKETLVDDELALAATKDSNGTELKTGDSVTIIKDLVVKGAGFTAKRGTLVKRILLTDDDPTHIEGKVNGTQIYLLSKYLKKM